MRGVLTLPGWHGSGPEHWQTLWEQQSGYQRVQQHDCGSSTRCVATG